MNRKRFITAIIFIIILQMGIISNFLYSQTSGRSVFKDKKVDYEKLQKDKEKELQEKRDALTGKSKTQSILSSQETRLINLSSLKDISSIYIPEKFGKITQAYEAQGEKKHAFIVHIQDLHTNPEASLNLASILDVLVTDYNLGLVCSEGAEGIVDTSSVSKFPDKEAREKTAMLFIKSGELTGEEYLSITKYPDLPIWGIENKDIYFQNIAEFNKIMDFLKDSEVLINSIKGALTQLKPKIYSQKLLELDAKEAEYAEGKFDTNKYVDYILGLTKIDFSGYKNISLLKESLGLEAKVDQKKIIEQSQALLAKFQSLLKEKIEIDTLLEKANLFKSQKISPYAFYSYLDELARKYVPDELAKYPDLFQFVDYLTKVNSLDSMKLFQEIEELTYQIKDALSENDTQKLLTKAIRHIKYLDDFFNIKMANEQLDYYYKHKNEFKLAFFEDFLKQNLKKYGIDMVIDYNPALIDAHLPELEHFYDIAYKRDAEMVQNAINEIEKRKVSLAAIVTGGFHTRGLTNVLKEKGYSHIVAMPFSSTETDEENYRFLLSGKRKPITDLIEEVNK